MQMKHAEIRLDKSRMHIKHAELRLNNLYFGSSLLIIAVNGSVEI